MRGDVKAEPWSFRASSVSSRRFTCLMIHGVAVLRLSRKISDTCASCKCNPPGAEYPPAAGPARHIAAVHLLQNFFRASFLAPGHGSGTRSSSSMAAACTVRLSRPEVPPPHGAVHSAGAGYTAPAAGPPPHPAAAAPPDRPAAPTAADTPAPAPETAPPVRGSGSRDFTQGISGVNRIHPRCWGISL